MNNPINSIPLPPLYYYPKEKCYYKADQAGKWISINESSTKLHIVDAGYSNKKVDGNSEVDQCLMKIQERQNIAYAAPLAGYRAGHYNINKAAVLVTESPWLIEPKAGEWPTIRTVLTGLFTDPVEDQLPYVYGWLKMAITSVRSGKGTPGQAFAMAGPVGAGKSLFQSIVTELLGGRSAKPYLFMTDKTTFNGDLFRGEHLMVEDESESTDIRSRRHFAAAIKSITVNRNQHCHGKNKEALTLTPIWRLTISLNNEPERLMVLPPLDDDVADKIILLKAHVSPMPMPTVTPDEVDAFWQRLLSEMPAFIQFLLEYQIPETLRNPRFGIVHFHHPELVKELAKTAPEYRLLTLIDAGLFAHPPIALPGYGEDRPWVGTAIQLETHLKRQDSPVSHEARQLLSHGNSCGTYLGRLEKQGGDDGRVHSRNGHDNTKIWTITRPAVTAEDDRAVDVAEEAPPLPPALAA